MIRLGVEGAAVPAVAAAGLALRPRVPVTGGGAPLAVPCRKTPTSASEGGSAS